ncbi:ubiquitin-like-conjugating enzyme ATG3 [Entomortierella parvispora]|uniref:Autophagy-related protein 3 n=1 Tax=Entomortierella parvispora TaxID=205924 RepID=A0A9P3LZ20_9FUNG|nr:ubiquitin-like-conjugating enzyme ATG3 [Entomortierella parvispora]
MNSVQNIFFGIREYLSPVLKNSKFKETGCITPEEFEAAGDFLVYKCPTWSWEGGEPSKRRDYLLPDKQFLITRNVPCLRRVKHMEYTDEDQETQIESDGGDAWVMSHSSRVSGGPIEEIAGSMDEDVDEEAEAEAEAQLAMKAMERMQLQDQLRSAAEEEIDLDNIPDMGDIPDMDDFDTMEEEVDPATLAPAVPTEVDPGDKILNVRTYDVFITYDKYYQTPRMWLFGYDEHRRPLVSSQIFEDVSQDYAKKTVTIETHPHLNMSLASIHPCRHGAVMKKIIEKVANDEGKEEPVRVDQYLIIFLKFMSSVVPTIDYDNTISA